MLCVTHWINLSTKIHFLKLNSTKCWRRCWKKRDTVCDPILTGYAESIIFHSFPFVYDHTHASTLSHGQGCAVLIVTPLNSLISDQTSILKKRGIEAAVLTTTITSTERRTESEDNASINFEMSIKTYYCIFIKTRSWLWQD